ncbi:MAG: hypothetical protein A2Y33_13730 [Spirochaetes bacterium GWF1_51_8]|nr:MAG: hypothetical protein A2Y33_13730 [Spirochaetes bacterium GWF1_51_8]
MVKSMFVKRYLAIPLFGIIALLSACGGGAVRPTIHPWSGDGNVFSAQFHGPVSAPQWGPGYWKIPDDARFVFQVSYAIYYVDKDGKILNAYNNLPSGTFEKTIVPPTAKMIFPLMSGSIVHLGQDGYLYHTEKGVKLMYAVPGKDEFAEFPKLPDGVRFVFQTPDYQIYFIDKDGGVYHAETQKPLEGKKGKAMTVPADCIYAFPIETKDGTDIYYFTKNGKMYVKDEKKEHPSYYIPPDAKFIFDAWGYILYVPAGKTENYSNVVALQQNNRIYNALTQTEIGVLAKKDGKEEFKPYTVPGDALNVFSVDGALFYLAKDGFVYGLSSKEKIFIDKKPVAIPTNARFIAPSDIGSKLSYVGIDNNIYDAVSGTMITALGDNKSEFKGIFKPATTTKMKINVTNKDGKLEEKEFVISAMGTIKLVPPDAKNFIGVTLYKTPTYLYVSGGKFFNAMIPNSPTPIFDKENFPQGWNIDVPSDLRFLFYSEEFSDQGKGLYYVSWYDGCVYDLVTRNRIHLGGVPYYVPVHATSIIVEKGKLYYTVDIKPVEEKK